jgi:hypothetical protein
MVEIEKPRIACLDQPEDPSYGKYVVEPLERGYGMTLGNSLRRILLSSLPGYAATSVKIAGGSKNDDSQAISAWQQGYYIGTLESDVEITSDILRAKDTNKVLKNRTVKNGNYAAATALKFSPSGTMAKFVIAYPASKDMTNNAYDSAKGLQSFFNNSSFEEYFGNFSRSIVKVAGADGKLDSTHAKDYAVWTWTPASAFSGTINFLIDLK